MRASNIVARSRLLVLALLFLVVAALAHPGVGIVQDGRGNVFFTDLKQVWKISSDGKMSVAVSNVHTHELCVDADNNLYGEHLWSENDAWRHRVWRLQTNGTLSDVVAAHDGFRSDYSFVRDRAGNMYWADGVEKPAIKKRSRDGKITTHATSDFRIVQWLIARPDGTLYLMDTGDLRRVSPDGKVTTVITKLSSQNPPPAKVSERNYYMGLWSDSAGDIYVAVAIERVVLRVRADGSAEVFARTGDVWSPSGGMFDRDRNLWLLEYNSTNAVRARRIAGNGNDEKIFETR